MTKNHILIIDDDPKEINDVAENLKKEYNLKEDEIVIWGPKSGDNDPLIAIEDKLEAEPTLVICDFDLTGKGGFNGLFGPVIEKMCHSRLIPVGEYTVNNKFQIPSTPNLFNIHVDKDSVTATAEIAAAYKGFILINELVNEKSYVGNGDLNYSNILARILNRGHLYYEFSKYLDSFERVNEFLIQYLENNAESLNDDEDFESTKNKVIAYVIGHVLLNTVLRYPGPILSERILCSYLSISESETNWLKDFFQRAIYKGPFSELGTFYWLETINDIVEENSDEIGNISYVGAFNQAVVKKINKNIKLFECKKTGLECQLGGYYCPV